MHSAGAKGPGSARKDRSRNTWGPLFERYSSPRPRKLLALDGGGIRGVITLEVLRAMETQLARATGLGRTFRLCDYFDYIAGTSTGAIIAAGLARGMSAAELLKFYVTAGKGMFTKAPLFRRVEYLYDAGPLKEMLQKTFAPDTTLEPEHLRCLLLIVMRNAGTDSAWPISSNPDAEYNRRSRKNCNLTLPLWELVRASTAAPIFFPRQVLQLDPTSAEQTFAFVDGGTTPYNNPAFLLFRMATEPKYMLSWPRGEKNLLVISVGTGGTPIVDLEAPDTNPAAWSNVLTLLRSLMYSSQIDQDINCRTVGRCVHGAPIDREIGDLIPREDGAIVPLSKDQGRAFVYARYDTDLSPKGLDALGLTTIDPVRVSRLDSVEAILDLQAIGQRLAEDVHVSDWGSFVP